jgi:hypothetical protein
MATVTSCKYDVGAGRAIAFGIPTRKHFVIRFNYWANGELHTGQFRSSIAIPQGHIFPLTYDPDHPHEHTEPHGPPPPPSPRLAIGVIGLAGSLILAVLWFAIVHGCR